MRQIPPDSAGDSKAGSSAGLRCPVCRRPDGDFMMAGFDRLFRRVPGKFKLYRCLSCHSVFQHPMPDQEAIETFYPEEYWWEAGRSKPSALARAMAGLESAYREIMVQDHVRFVEQCARKTPGTGRALLDIGCGSGTFLHAARRRGFKTYGMDFSARAVSAARRQYGLDVRQGRIGSDIWDGLRFDFITLFHVLEHLPEPGRAIASVAALLNPGGSLIVQVPNVESLQARLFGSRWYGLDVPRHLVNFSRDGLRFLLRAAGLHGTIRTRFSWRDNPAALASSLAPALDPIGRKGRKPGTTAAVGALAEFAYFVLFLACVPAAALESLAGSGATLWVHAALSGNVKGTPG